jgi:hypothetical protein
MAEEPLLMTMAVVEVLLMLVEFLEEIPLLEMP